MCASMSRIGAHMSVAGGVSKAVDRGGPPRLRGDPDLQPGTPISGRACRWTPSEVRRFRTRLDDTGIGPAVAHASYLINLATTAPALRAQSIAALIDELDRAHALGLLGVVLHPGTCTAGTEEDGLRLIADAVRDVLAQHPRRTTLVIFEHTAGQGRTARTPIRASRGDPRAPRRVPARRRVPRYVPSRRGGLRPGR